MPIAFVMVASVTALGIFSSQQSRNTIHARLSGTFRSVVPRGVVIVGDSDSNGNADSPRFTLTTATDGESVDLTQVITYIRYSGAFQKVIADTASEFSITPLGKSNGDYILDEDETFEITMLNLETTLSNPLVVRRSFEMEIITRDGAVLHLARTMTIRLNVWISLPF